MGEDTRNDLSQIEKQLISQKAEGSAIWGLRSLVDKILSDQKLIDIYALDLESLLKELVEKNTNYKNYPEFYPLSMYLRGQLLIAKEKLNLGYEAYSQSIVEYNNPSSALALVADIANKGHPQLALQLLTEVENVYKVSLEHDSSLNKIKNEMKIDLLTNHQQMTIVKSEQHKEK